VITGAMLASSTDEVIGLDLLRFQRTNAITTVARYNFNTTVPAGSGPYPHGS